MWSFLLNLLRTEPVMVATGIVAVVNLVLRLDEAVAGQLTQIIAETIGLLVGGGVVRANVTPNTRVPAVGTDADRSRVR